MKITPDNITDLKPNEVFVFGSNLSGIHGKGAALQAIKWGAVRGVGRGPSGQTYAIPTRGYWRQNIRGFTTLSLEEIGEHVHDFLIYSGKHPNAEFLVTKIGCGYAGLTPIMIGPLFGRSASIPPNVSLPEVFWSFCQEAL